MRHARPSARVALRLGALAAILLALSTIRAAGAATPHARLQAFTESASQGGDVSRNWAGYVDERPGIDSVSGTWIVPQVSLAASTGASSVWVGIGGSNSNDLIQAGTEQDTERGRPAYYAWFEMLPDVAQRVRLQVQPGDQLSVSISELAPDQWSIDIINATSGGEVRVPANYHSQHASADWVVEAPTSVNIRTGAAQIVTLADFGTVHMTGMAETAAGMALNPTDATPVVMALNRVKLVDVSNVQNSAFDAQYVAAVQP